MTTESWNEALLIYLHNFMAYEFVADVVYFMADGPIFFLPIFLIIAWFIKKQNSSRMHLLHMFYACVIGIGISLFIQQFVDIARPESALSGSANLILAHIPDASFPSDHATVSVAFLTSLFLAGYKKIGYMYWVAVIVMNLSRVMAGVHWPLDIIAGTIVWISAAYISFYGLAQFTFVKNMNLFIIKISRYLKI